ncbi:DegT/DnrJ/EryC1/StrS aminotransferase family protein [Candidatus Woesearchaeota archaeon]|nr:DegT/DnrJ/EryC1/StrS aminotransferase family protein [Candidatus Woesearchaeota archaeon]
MNNAPNNPPQTRIIPIAEPVLGEKEIEYATECIKTNWISSKGAYVTQFEKQFSKYCQTDYGIAVANGTVALHLALLALDIKKGDEVIIPDFTFAATINAILYTGATPVLVDVEQNTGNIDVNKIKEKITSRTKAIMPVHIYGNPCKIDEIKDLCSSRNLYLIEDCAEAHGAEYKKKKVGSFSDIACFSFFGNKIITTGEGGMCITNNEELAEKMRVLKDHGMSKNKRYWHEIIGYNYRLTNIQAAIGVAQLENIDKFIDTRRKNAKLYNSLLQDTKGITLQEEGKYAKHVYWMYSILLNKDAKLSRTEIMQKLKSVGIETREFFYPLHIMPPYKQFAIGKYPVTDYISQKGMNLPSSSRLSKDDVCYICEKIKEIL